MNTLRRTIVCLCGPSKFSQAYKEAELRETLADRIVLTIGCDFKSDSDLLLAGEITPADKECMDRLHHSKVYLADESLFLNVGGYLGTSSLIEHFLAEAWGKIIRYLEPPMPANRYHLEAEALGVAWLLAEQAQGRNPGLLLPVNRRLWFLDDYPSVTNGMEAV